MSLSFELSIEVSEQYDFNKNSLNKLKENFTPFSNSLLAILLSFIIC